MPAPASWSIPRAWSTWSSITSPPPAACPSRRRRCTEWWTSVCRFLEPQHVYHSLVKSHGFVVENSLVFVPYLPDYLVDTEDPKLVQEIRDKIQDAVTIARELGDDNIPVGMVGLGAYTSIVTQNCTTLNDYEVSVTSGNAYTVALTLLGLLRGAEEQGIDPRRACAAVVGATGNIGLVLAQFLVLAVDRLLLVGRDRDGQRKLGYARLACIETLLRAIRDELTSDAGTSRLTGLAARLRDALEPLWPGLAEAPDALGDFVRDGDIHPEHRDLPGAPAGVGGPARIAPRRAGDPGRPGVPVRGGPGRGRHQHPRSGADPARHGAPRQRGVLHLGAEQSRRRFPRLDAARYSPSTAAWRTCRRAIAWTSSACRADDLVYGCLAETLALGFEGSSKSFCKGTVTMAQVDSILAAARRHGFGLGRAPTR